MLYSDRSELYDEDGMHIRAKTPIIKEMSKFLKILGFEISVEEERKGINLHSKIDRKGNTILQRLIKENVFSSTNQNLEDIKYILQYIKQHSKVLLTLPQDLI